MSDAAVNYGAVIGGVCFVLVLLVFLGCFTYLGVGPKCIRRLNKCLRSQHDRYSRGNNKHSELQQASVSQKPLLALPVPAPVQVSINLQQNEMVYYSPAKRPLPQAPKHGAIPVIYSRNIGENDPKLAKSAPDPARPEENVSSISPLSINDSRVDQVKGFFQNRIRRSDYETLALKLPSKPITPKLHKNVLGIRPAARYSPSQTLPLERRRGLSNSHLSLSTIKNNSSGTGIPPDCLYADSDPYLQGAQLVQSSLGASLKAEIGSANSLSAAVAAVHHQQQQQQQQQLPPRSNTSSSDCHDWSPPQPQLSEDGVTTIGYRDSQLLESRRRWRKSLGETRRQSYQQRFRLLDQTVVENAVSASAEGDVTIFELNDAGMPDFVVSEVTRSERTDHSTSF